jgi:glycosyltransferase involved in cell wall biosynthesis
MRGESLKVLFVTRKFLPDVGGMEIAATHLYRELAKRCHVRLINCRPKSPLQLPLVPLKALLGTAWFTWKWKPDVILFQDVVTALSAPLVAPLHRRKAVIAHGLDITYGRKAYRALAGLALRRCEAVVCISNATREACLREGLARREKLKVIHYAVNDDLYMDGQARRARELLAGWIGVDLSERFVILTTGRLVRRKGISWFVRNCLEHITTRHPRAIYVVVGEGEMKGEIRRAANEKGLSKHVVLTGRATKEQLRWAYNGADLFVMPNIPLPNNMEGFGLVALEACSCGLPVVASDLEGIKDALRNGEGGLLVESENAEAFISAVTRFIENEDLRKLWSQRARKFFLEKYGWEKTVSEYLELFRELAENGGAATSPGSPPG